MSDHHPAQVWQVGHRVRLALRLLNLVLAELAAAGGMGQPHACFVHGLAHRNQPDRVAATGALAGGRDARFYVIKVVAQLGECFSAGVGITERSHGSDNLMNDVSFRAF